MNRTAAAVVDPGTTFELLRETAARLTGAPAARCQEFFFSLAGHTVRLRIVGRSLADEIVGSFAHLAVNAAGDRVPALSIDVWDEAASEPISTALQHDHLGPQGVITSSADGNIVAQARPDTVTVLDRAGGRIISCVRASTRSLGERARPFSLALTLWCRDRGIHLIHGGMISDGRGVLFGGLSGSGKSTATLACALAQYEFLADDCLALGTGIGKDVYGHSVYGSLTLDARCLANHPRLDKSAVTPRLAGDDKQVVFLNRCPTVRLGRSAPIHAVVLVRLSPHAETTFTRASKREALLRLAPSSLIKRAVAPHDCLRQMALLVDRVPCYWLDLGVDSRTIPDRIGQLLAEAA